MRLLRVMVRRLRVCFNPRICKRCDCTHHSLLPSLSVSIHASVKDATIIQEIIRCTHSVSIHASVKDATFSNHFVHNLIRCFNPRICKRCDSILFNIPVSARGFNPRICKRCDIHGILTGSQFKRFQSTHL